MNFLSDFEKLFNPTEKIVVSCSGGVDSLLLAVISNRVFKKKSLVAHIISPAVPRDATERVTKFAIKEDWQLRLLKSKEFDDEDYLQNPVNRCYFCKTNIYGEIKRFYSEREGSSDTLQILSGTNLDDLGEYRPGLIAAKESNVRHPFIELGINKTRIREIARNLNLPFSDLPASPCLSSRVYTGTRITKERLQAVYQAEEFLKHELKLAVVRCRIRERQMFVEVSRNDHKLLHNGIITSLKKYILKSFPVLSDVSLDSRPYRSGRAFIQA